MSDRDDKKPEGQQPPEQSAPADAAAEPANEAKAPQEQAPAAPETAKPETEAPVASDAEAEAAAKAEAEAKAKAAAEARAKAAAAKAAAEAAKPPWERDPQTPEWADSESDPLVEALRKRHADAVASAASFADELTLKVPADSLKDVALSLRDEHRYKFLVDLCGVDYPDREERFEVVYHVMNLETNSRVRLKVGVPEGAEVPSVVDVWPAANWQEREVYDMYGVRFAGHPDMTRILLWEGFNGYPLRKDFPVEGIDTGSAIYPEYYDGETGPVAGTGTGWKPPEPPAEPAAAAEGGAAEASGDE